ncbi:MULTISPECIES: DeoR/GlpR family DNA-binding transcription regulator [unclassified Sporosarcina]|uniref:DeoR/GlpR family DNA-binding transcription regulator n=1 Tax=unclassified Sporosarcina TaxID=2647733 RepID=UPI00203ACAAD|nr:MULTISPECIES: DeoR/GlpR family DNA-binding transcription regulator [unclassified Sporosarcina]GKV65958.1 DeoR family transcriptional regulator [Sporosarcina sp. NCCP-2331]GLB56042.1 DeoR family transcriptional regulator [Sporosarcina sp. NCCP-2378]
MLLSEERKLEIMDELNRTGKLKVAELSAKFKVSPETIRRDLTFLEEEGVLKRVYGGAIKSGYQMGEPPFSNRTEFNTNAKKKIGKLGADLISDGDTVFIDTGTTTAELALQIVNKEDVRILTNCIPVALALMESLNKKLFSGEVILLGGTLDPIQQSISGQLSEPVLDNFNLDKAFISIGGISLVKGVSDYNLNECLLSKKVISNSKQVIVLTDQSKIGVQALCKIAPLSEVDVVLCDEECPASWKNDIMSLGIEWISE